VPTQKKKEDFPKVFAPFLFAFFHKKETMLIMTEMEKGESWPVI